MSDEPTETGQRTARVIEEAYVSLQQSMRTYRQARDQSNGAAGLPQNQNPVIVLQDAVQTFYELVRPYLADEPRLAEYWRGALAKHADQQFHSTGEALEYYREHSVGVWQTQGHTGAIPANQLPSTQPASPTATADGGQPSTPAEWHEALNLPPTVRVLYVQQAPEDDVLDGWYYKEGRFSVIGLRELDTWAVEARTQRESGSGFMSGETATHEIADPEPAPKVETAARMLVEVADELGAIANYEPKGDRIHGTPKPD